MSQARKELKVGFFVLICLALTALLMVQFGKGTTFFRPTYTIILKSGNAGGLKARSTVFMAGVPVGTISRIQLNPDGKGVTIYLRIYKQFEIHRDATFVIEQFGFLGDQYIAIYPGENKAPRFENMDEAVVKEPFNLQEVARGAAGFIQRIDETAKRLNDTIADVRHSLLNEKTLTNLSSTVVTFRDASEDMQLTVQNLKQLVLTNELPVSQAVSNLVLFTENLNQLGTNANSILATNGPHITSAINNIQRSTETLTNLLGGVQAGQGVVGGLLKDPQMAANFSLLSSNLAVTSSNLNRLGLWGILWQHKPPKSKAPPKELERRP
jgi:phospholipid/cholesterol/gamma-HCH transport system substrate-binding protein